MKNKKIKKYFSGATIKGGLTTGIDKLGDSGAVAGMAGGLLIDSLAKKQDPKYTNQLKDGDQNTGRAIGNGLGQGLNLLVPGLGSVAAPILGAAGAAIQRGFQGDKLDAIKKATDAKEANDKFNDTVDGVDSTTTMKKQFKDGGKVKVSKKEIAAESTSTPKVLAPKLITSTDDIKDTLTGKFLKKKIMTGSDTDEVSDQQDRSILREHVLNGNPKIRVKGPNQRSNYFMAKNEMHLSEFNDYPAELAHSKQTKDKGADYVTNKNRAERTKYGDMPRYSIKGTIENEAHDTIEPVLRDKMSRKTAVQNIKTLNNLAGKTYGFSQNLKTTKYSKGTKVIEIEGKKTPEIHTDEDFNIKNLGTTPHSKGGDKVLAEHGDVVFPTQNSPKKYKEVVTAIMNKDKSKLKKIQAKLPEDKDPSKYGDGTNKVKGKPAPFKDENGRYSRKNDPIIQAGESVGNFFKAGMLKGTVNDPNRIKKEAAVKSTKANGPGMDINSPWAAGLRGVAPSIVKGKGNVKTNPTVKGGAVKTNNGVAPVKSVGIQDMKIRNTIDNGSLPTPKMMDVKSTSTPSSTTPTSTDAKGKGSLDGNSVLEMAPIAYNLGKGLFGKTEKANRQYVTPEMEKYNDTSDPLRRQSSSMYSQDKANNRNLSAGVAGNARSNFQAASNAEFGRQNQINAQEINKELDINNRNVGVKNHGKLVNNQLFNQYEDTDAANRAAKEAHLSQGLNELGALGSRNTLEKNERAANRTMIESSSAGTMYKANFDKKNRYLNSTFRNDVSPEELAHIESRSRLAAEEKKKREVPTASKGIKKVKYKGKK